MLSIFNAVVYIQNHTSIDEYKEDFLERIGWMQNMGLGEGNFYWKFFTLRLTTRAYHVVPMEELCSC